MLRTDSAHRAARQVVGLEYNDYVYFMPRREHCDGLKALEDNAGWDRYSRCACAGAMISIEGGEVRLVRVRVTNPNPNPNPNPNLPRMGNIKVVPE